MIPADDLRKLVGILGCLGSDHSGERSAAGLKAQLILDRRRVIWSDQLQPAPPQLGSVHAGMRPMGDHQREAMWLLRCCNYPWDEWRQTFLQSISSRRSPLIAGQFAKLRECRELAGAWSERCAA